MNFEQLECLDTCRTSNTRPPTGAVIKMCSQGCNFCATCLETAAGVPRTCPNCRGRITCTCLRACVSSFTISRSNSAFQPNPTAQQLNKTLPRRCPHCDEWVTDTREHRTTCNYAPFICPLSNCKLAPLPSLRDFEEHLANDHDVNFHTGENSTHKIPMRQENLLGETAEQEFTFDSTSDSHCSEQVFLHSEGQNFVLVWLTKGRQGGRFSCGSYSLARPLSRTSLHQVALVNGNNVGLAAKRLVGGETRKVMKLLPSLYMSVDQLDLFAIGASEKDQWTIRVQSTFPSVNRLRATKSLSFTHTSQHSGVLQINAFIIIIIIIITGVLIKGDNIKQSKGHHNR